MKCFVCENEVKSSMTDDVIICAECAKKAGNHYLMKCVSCGSYGFLERTAENKARLETKMGISIDEFAPIVVIPSKGCPDCLATRDPAKRDGGGNC